MKLRILIGLAVVGALSGVGLALVTTHASTTPCPSEGIVHCLPGTGGERLVSMHPLLPLGIVLLVGAVGCAIAAVVVARRSPQAKTPTE